MTCPVSTFSWTGQMKLKKELWPGPKKRGTLDREELAYDSGFIIK